MTPPSLHHVAFACRDLDETHAFYREILELPLVHTEAAPFPGGGTMKHVFYDLGDGSCLAFFALPKAPARTAISTDLGLPVWVNHFAIRVDEERQRYLAGRLEAAGVDTTMDVDHGWCHSLYFTDPNGILVELCRDTPGLTPDPEEAERLRTASV